MQAISFRQALAIGLIACSMMAAVQSHAEDSAPTQGETRPTTLTVDEHNLQQVRIAARQYMTGDGVVRNVHEGLRLWTLVANDGDPVAQRIVAGILQISVDERYLHDEHYLQQLNAEARRILADMKPTLLTVDEHNLQQVRIAAKQYMTGDGVVRNVHEGLRLWTLVANDGDPEAQRIVAGILQSGEAGRASPKDVEQWYQKAASQGNEDAQFQLAANAVNRSDPLEGAPLAALEAAAAKGHPGAVVLLGELLLTGKQGVAQDVDRGLALLVAAADSGNSQANYLLATCYEHGEGVPKDAKKAYEYAYRTVSVSPSDSLDNVAPWAADIEKQLPEAEIKTIQAKVKLWATSIK